MTHGRLHVNNSSIADRRPTRICTAPLLHVLYTNVVVILVARRDTHPHQYVVKSTSSSSSATLQQPCREWSAAGVSDVDEWMRASKLQLYLTSCFPIVDTCLSCELVKIWPDKVVRWCLTFRGDDMTCHVVGFLSASEAGQLNAGQRRWICPWPEGCQRQVSCRCQNTSLRCRFFQLSQLCPVVRSPTAEATKTLIAAFISCRICGTAWLTGSLEVNRISV